MGGDGLFQEVVNGVLALRREGGLRSEVAEGLRLAQIPAGSTDAVAWSVNGTRSAEAAALHVALGEGWAHCTWQGSGTPRTLVKRWSHPGLEAEEVRRVRAAAAPGWT